MSSQLSLPMDYKDSENGIVTDSDGNPLGKYASEIWQNALDKMLIMNMPQNGIRTDGMYDLVLLVNKEIRQARAEYPMSEENQAYESLCYKICDGLSNLHYDMQNNEESDWNRWLVTRGEYAGTWPKRFKSYMYKNFDVNIPSGLLSRLGEVVSRMSITDNKSYIFSPTNYGNWEPGNFQESTDSCWWGCYNSSREALIENGGGSVLFYESEYQFRTYHKQQGIGRAWYWIKSDNSVYIFNAYGLGLLEIARVIATRLGMSYKKVEFSYDDSWVNGNVGYELYTGNKPYGDFTLELDFNNGYTCDNCGRHIDDGDEHSGDDNIYCEDCYYDLYSSCDYCGNDICRDDLNRTRNDEYVCNHCLSRHYQSCDNCGEWERDYDAMHGYDGYNNATTLCQTCGEDEFSECESCNDLYYSDTITVVNGRSLCQECANSQQEDDNDESHNLVIPENDESNETE